MTVKFIEAPILGFCAYSGTGKTSLLCRLIPVLKSEHGMRVAVIKHAHHTFDTDQPGKDSYELRKAGARQTLVSSSRRWALVKELDECESEPGLSELIARLDHTLLDLVLIEGFKREAFSKIELHRKATGHPLMCQRDKNIIALACDTVERQDVDIPVFSINDVKSIASFIASFRESCNGSTGIDIFPD